MTKFKRIISVLITIMLTVAVIPMIALADGEGYEFEANLTDNFDDGTSVFSWKPSLCPTPEFVSEDGRGKVIGIKYIKKKATGSADIKMSGLKGYMTGDINYVSFDIKPMVARNYVITMPSQASLTPLSLITSSNGWICATTDDITNAVPSDVSKTFDEIKNEKEDEAIAWDLDIWHNIKFIIKPNDIIMVYVDDVCLKTVSTDQTFDNFLIKNVSDVDIKETENSLYFDNFEIGEAFSANTPVNVSALDITDDGIIEITFDKNVDSNTLNTDTVKILSNGINIEFENPQYDDSLKKWTARLVSYSYLKEYKVTVSGAKGTSGNDVNDFEKTFKGSETIFFPELYDTFDDKTSSRDWTPQWSRTSYIPETGRGYVMGMRYAQKVAETSTDVNVKELSAIDFDKNSAYVSFDLKATVLRDYSIILKSTTSKNMICITTSKNGWLYVHRANVTQKGPENDASVFAKNMADAESLFGSDKVKAWNKDVWYKLTFLIDKTNGTVSLYIDDKFITAEEGLSSEDMGMNILNIKMHSASDSWDMAGNESLRVDNFQVGSFVNIDDDIPAEVRNIKAIPIEGNPILSGAKDKITRKLNGFKVTTYDGIDESTINNIKVVYNDTEIDCEYSLSDNNVVFIKPSTLPKNGDSITIMTEGLKYRSGDKLDNYEGRFNSYEDDEFAIIGFKKSEADSDIYPSGIVVNTTDKNRNIIITIQGYKKNAKQNEVMNALDFKKVTVKANTVFEFGEETNEQIKISGNFDNVISAVLDGNNYYPIEVIE